MRRGWKIGIAAIAALLVLLICNALIVGGKTESAEVTVPGGRLLDLPSGEVQVVERGPRNGPPIVLIHCFSCAIDWWDRVTPALARQHRVVAIDLLGHGGSEKPDSGYTPENQARLVAEALERLGVSDATVAGHSLGGSVAVALAEGAPSLVDRVAIIDMPPDRSYGDLGFIAGLAFQPVLGEALWTIKPDFSVKQGLGVAFAPDYEVPDAFVEDVNQLTYTAYDESPAGNEDYLDEKSLDRRMRAVAKPLLVIMGAEEQIVDDPQRALNQFGTSVPKARTHLIAGAGHSPNVERPARTAALILAFANEETDRPKGPRQSRRSPAANPGE
jgi:pimeloyl-ACP methyl ester carboxylesterase